jgi:hypothetical protein
MTAPLSGDEIITLTERDIVDSDADASIDAGPSKTLLRALIVTEYVLIIVAIVVGLATESLLPDPLRTFVEEQANAELTNNDVAMLIIGLPLIVLLIVSSIGLFMLWPPARILYLIGIASGLVLMPVFGPYVESGWGTAFEDAASVVSGVILALVYFSPFKRYFETPRPRS